MKQLTNEEQLRIVLQNYDRLKAELQTLSAKYESKCEELEKYKTYLTGLNERVALFFSDIDDFLKGKAENSKPVSSQEAHEENKMTQNNKFILYIRQLQNVYEKTHALHGISKLANQFGVSAVTKVDFFEHGLNAKGISDNKILSVYKQIKKR